MPCLFGRESIERVGVDAVEAHGPRTRGNRGVPGHEHATFAGRNCFVGVEAENSHVARARSDHLSGASAGQGVRGILQHPQSMFPGYLEDRVHRRRTASKMHGMIALVRGGIAASISVGSMHTVALSMSTNAG